MMMAPAAPRPAASSLSLLVLVALAGAAAADAARLAQTGLWNSTWSILGGNPYTHLGQVAGLVPVGDGSGSVVVGPTTESSTGENALEVSVYGPASGKESGTVFTTPGRSALALVAPASNGTGGAGSVITLEQNSVVMERDLATGGVIRQAGLPNGTAKACNEYYTAALPRAAGRPGSFFAFGVAVDEDGFRDWWCSGIFDAEKFEWTSFSGGFGSYSEVSTLAPLAAVAVPRQPSGPGGGGGGDQYDLVYMAPTAAHARATVMACNAEAPDCTSTWSNDAPVTAGLAMACSANGTCLAAVADDSGVRVAYLWGGSQSLFDSAPIPGVRGGFSGLGLVPAADDFSSAWLAAGGTVFFCDLSSYVGGSGDHVACQPTQAQWQYGTLTSLASEPGGALFLATCASAQVGGAKAPQSVVRYSVE